MESFLTFTPERDFKLLLVALFLPLVGYVIQIFFGRFLPRKGDWLLTGGMFFTMLITVRGLFQAIYAAVKFDPATATGPMFFHQSADHGMVFDWFYRSGAGDNVVAGILYDPLGASLFAVVGIVSFLVHLFATGYMHGDRRYHIFFANISLFTFAMLGLVLSDNLLFLFIFWELMGLMSYLLIGHFSHDPDSPRIKHAAAACKKAFLTTRVGDVCLFIGMMMFYREFGTFRFYELWEMTTQAVEANGGEWPAWMTVAGLFIFGGTVGKSAQFPLHIWLPDAMEGPTPVSAMIHAATMVAAGVFLLGRTYPMLSPEVLGIVTAVGAITAIFAATIGTTVNDIKGVLAYSTISQLGFMVAAIGTGGIGLIAGLFHMVTHAFFKACLFLCAGSVIHGCHHEQDMRKMGGLWKKMPITFGAMLVSTLAIAGIPLFSGFYSKDKIIQAAFMNWSMGHGGAAAFASFILPLAAAITAFYMFRLIFMTFFGQPRDHHIHDHAHESPKNMTIPLMVLGFLAVFGGSFWILPSIHGHTWFEALAGMTEYVSHGETTAIALGSNFYPGVEIQQGYVVTESGDTIAHAYHVGHNMALAVSLTVALLGIFIAAMLYLWRRWNPATVTNTLGEVYTTVLNKYYIDEFVNGTVIKGCMVLARVQKTIDEKVVDGAVLLVGRINVVIAKISKWIDENVVDGLVRFSGAITDSFGSVVRLFQSGRIQQYATAAVAGGLLVAAWVILS